MRRRSDLWRKAAQGSVAALLIWSTFAVAAGSARASAQTINITVDGMPLDTPVAPRLVEGRTLVSIRYVSEAVGANVAWNGNSQQVTVTRGSDRILLTIGQTSASVDGQTMPLDVAPQLVDSRTMVPIRFVAEALGLGVAWDGPTRTVEIQRRAHVQGMQVASSPGKVRLTFPTTLPVQASVSLLADQRTLQIAVPGTDASSLSQSLAFDDGAVATVSAASSGGTAYITIALPYYLGHSVVASSGQNIAVDVVTSPLYQRRIWVDAGHGQVPGGQDDTGAIGTTYGVSEKERNLQVALALQNLLQASGATVYMTRTGDVGVNYTDRPKLVNAVTPAIEAFVSIHHNSLPGDSSVHGVETYYWNPQSQALASAMDAAVASGLGEVDRGVRTYDYYVVKYTTAPAILVEMGYLSNPAEEKAIGDGAYPVRAAAALKNGLLNYFRQLPASGAGAGASAGSPTPNPVTWQAGETAVVATGTDVLNLRQGPGASYAVMATLKDGTLVKVLSVSGGWAYVDTGSLKGYVSTDWLAHQQ